MSSSKKIINPTRQRGTPSPGTNPVNGNRVSPRRATGTGGTGTGRGNGTSTQTSSTHRRVGSASAGNTAPRIRTAPSLLNTRQPSRDDISEGGDDEHDDFLSKSSGYPSTPDRADDEVLSIYLESLKNPRERDSILNFVNQQKIDAGYGVDPRQPPNPKKGQVNPISSLNMRQPTIVVGVTDIESNLSDVSDSATEVIGYSNTSSSKPQRNHAKQQNGFSQHSQQSRQSTSFENTDLPPKSSDAPILSPRPGAQRAILEIASQMTPEEIREVVELLARGHGLNFAITQLQSAIPSPHSSHPTPNSTSKHHIPSPNSRRGKSGPPILQTSEISLNEDDEEVIHHTKYNESYRMIPPSVPLNPPQASNNPPLLSSSQHSLPLKTSGYGRCGSAASNASGTNSNCNSRNTTPINPSSKKSPIPNQHEYCPTVLRECSLTARSTDSITPSQSFHKPTEVVPPLVLPRTERVPSNKTQSQNHQSSRASTSSTTSSNSAGNDTRTSVDDIRSALLIDSGLQSPRGSAFDDCSLSSSSSNFTSASTRSGRSKGSASVPTANKTKSSAPPSNSRNVR